MSGRRWSVAGSSIVVIAVVGVALMSARRIAHALCIQPFEDGQWVNADANTRSLTHINLRFICQDQILNGQPYPPGPPWYVHAWGKARAVHTAGWRREVGEWRRH